MSTSVYVFYYFYVKYLPKNYTGLPKIGLIEEAPISAFPVLQKRPKIAKMTQNDLLSLEMVFTEPLQGELNKTLLVS